MYMSLLIDITMGTDLSLDRKGVTELQYMTATCVTHNIRCLGNQVTHYMPLWDADMHVQSLNTVI